MILNVVCEDREGRCFSLTAVDLSDRRLVYKCVFPISNLLAMSEATELDLYEMLVQCLSVSGEQLKVNMKKMIELSLVSSKAVIKTPAYDQSQEQEELSKDKYKIEGEKTEDLFQQFRILDVLKMLTQTPKSAGSQFQPAPEEEDMKKMATDTNDHSLSLDSAKDSLDILIDKKNDQKRLDVYALKIQRVYRGMLARKKYRQLRSNESVVVYKKGFFQDHISISCTIMKRLANQEYTIYGYNFDMRYYFKSETFFLPESKAIRPDTRYFDEVFSKTLFDLDSKTLYYKDFLIEDASGLMGKSLGLGREQEKRQAEVVLKKTVMTFLNISAEKKKSIPEFDQRFKVIGKKTMVLGGVNIAILVDPCDLVSSELPGS